ncbi:MAG: cytochrome B5 [Nitrospirae bacterium]|nr:cytochrome B5 [Nitrospirota bacterium]
MKKLAGLILFCFLLIPGYSSATTDYARQTGFACGVCHVDTIGGGPLTKEGEKYLEDMKTKGLYRPLKTSQKIIRFIIGYIHLLTAIAWFGTILYVHILLKPAYAAKGLPKGELVLGWMSMIVLAVTGTLLSIARIPSWGMLFTTRFGILLSIKIALFLIMVTTAVIVTFFIGPRLKRRLRGKAAAASGASAQQDVTPEQLSHFDGREGRPAYVAYAGKVYDVTMSRLWKDGSHARKHLAGSDLTAALKTAPHGEEKVVAMKLVGELKTAAQKAEKPFHEKLFFFFAYMNLAFVFLLVFVIALMRWS